MTQAVNLERWQKTGWLSEFVPNGAWRSEVIVLDHSKQTFVLLGRIFDSAGNELLWRNAYRHHVEEVPTGVVVIFYKVLNTDIILLYKLIDEPTEPSELPVSRKRGRKINEVIDADNAEEKPLVAME
jgi:hypothetical protein